MLHENRQKVEGLLRRLTEILKKNPSSPLAHELSEIKETINKLT
jgi:hypothetical protein